MILYFFIFTLGMNIYGISLMYLDKKRSIKGRWRISERRLFFVAFCFGGLGILLGMIFFRHKTQRVSFKILIPIAIVVEVTLILYLLNPFSLFGH